MVATTTQVGAVAAEVGGDAIELTVLLEPGIEAHDFELTPEDGAALEQARSGTSSSSRSEQDDTDGGTAR